MGKPRWQVNASNSAELRAGKTRNPGRVVDVLPVDSGCSSNLSHPTGGVSTLILRPMRTSGRRVGTLARLLEGRSYE